MPNRIVTERLAADVAVWQADGLIDHDTAVILKDRWTQPGFEKTMLVRYLGLVGGYFLVAGVLGMIAAMAGSPVFAVLVLGASSAGLLSVGVRLSGDKAGRYPYSSKVILAVATMLMVAALSMLVDLVGLGSYSDFVVTGLVAIPISAYVAYRYCNVFVLILMLVQFFYWVGSASGMMGRSSYIFGIQDPLTMAVIAAAVVVGSLGMGNSASEGQERFPHVYQAVGLAYFNLSLLILTLSDSDLWNVYLILFSAAGVAQIVLGARLKNGLIIGFGVTSVAVNMFTRYFEAAWDRMDAGVFFLIGGSLLFGIAAVCERQYRPSQEAECE